MTWCCFVSFCLFVYASPWHLILYGIADNLAPFTASTTRFGNLNPTPVAVTTGMPSSAVWIGRHWRHPQSHCHCFLSGALYWSSVCNYYLWYVDVGNSFCSILYCSIYPAHYRQSKIYDYRLFSVPPYGQISQAGLQWLCTWLLSGRNQSQEQFPTTLVWILLLPSLRFILPQFSLLWRQCSGLFVSEDRG